MRFLFIYFLSGFNETVADKQEESSETVATMKYDMETNDGSIGCNKAQSNKKYVKCICCLCSLEHAFI